MNGKTVVVTGGTSGIGEVAAEALAQMGARIVLVARDSSRADSTLARLRQRGPRLAHSVHYADLTRLTEMKRVATQIASQEPRINVLINNAGALFAARQVTEDGLEYTFALNHMAYFVVTEGLRKRLVASAPARIVNTASDAHHGAILDFDDLQSEKTSVPPKHTVVRSSATSSSHANSLAASKERVSPRTAFIPALSPRALEIKAVA